MFLEGNKALILLAAVTLLSLLIGSIFIFAIRPSADLKPTSEGKTIRIMHRGGDNLYWDEIEISVTKGSNSSPHFDDPTSAKDYLLGGENTLSAQDGDKKFVMGESMTIKLNSKNGSSLEPGEFYHVIIKYRSSTDVQIMDKNVFIRREYG